MALTAEEALNEIVEMMKSGGTTASGPKSPFSFSSKALKELSDSLNSGSKTIRQIVGPNGDIDKALKQAAEAHRQHGKGVLDTTHIIRDLDKAISATTGAEREHLKAKRDAIAAENDMRLAKNSATESLKRFAGAAYNSAISIVKQLQTAEPTADMLVDTFANVAKNITKDVPLAGRVFGDGVDVFTTEMKKTFKAFESGASVGLYFSDGMIGMRNAAANAGMGLDMFVRSMVKNKENLAVFGGGLEGSAKEVGKIRKVMDAQGLTESLVRLGIGLDAQVEAMGEVANAMKYSAKKLLPDELAGYTASYAKNMKDIAAITGQEAKAKVAEQKRKNEIAAFRLKAVQKYGVEQAGMIDQTMAMLPDVVADAIRSKTVYGENVDATSAVMIANSPALAAMMARFEAGLVAREYAGAGAVERAAGVTAQYNAQARAEMERMMPTYVAGVMGSGIVKDISEKSMSMIDTLSRITPEAVASGAINKTFQGKADDLNNAYGKFTVSIIQSQVALEEGLTKGLQAASNAILDFAGVASSAAAQMRSLSSGEKSVGSGWLPGIAAGGGALGGMWAGAKTGAMFGRWLGPKGIIIGGALGAIGGGILGYSGANAISPSSYGTPKFALGGVANGPLSGYQAELHGTEAIVPLPEDRHIPVKLSGDLTDTMKEMLNKMDVFIEKSESLVSISEKQVRVLNDIHKASI